MSANVYTFTLINSISKRNQTIQYPDLALGRVTCTAPLKEQFLVSQKRTLPTFYPNEI